MKKLAYKLGLDKLFHVSTELFWKLRCRDVSRPLAFLNSNHDLWIRSIQHEVDERRFVFELEKIGTQIRTP